MVPNAEAPEPVVVHPFRDGNGLMAPLHPELGPRHETPLLAPVFTSIEEYLRRKTQASGDVLVGLGGHPASQGPSLG